MNMMKFAVFATGLLSASVVFAADPPPPAGGPGGPGGPGGRGRGGGMMVLNNEQRQTFQEALDNEKLRGLDEKLRAAQKDLVDAALAASYDEKTVRSKAEAVSKIQVDITVLRAKALAAVAPSLESEQKRQMAESPMGAMLLNGGGGFGGRGPGGPGGPGGGGARGGPGRPGGGGPDQKPKDQ